MAPLLGLRSRTTRQVCEGFLKELISKSGCRRVSVWSVDPVRSRIDCLLVKGEHRGAFEPDVRECCHRLAAEALARREITRIKRSVAAPGEGAALKVAALGEDLDLESAVSVPVVNTSNINQVLLLLNLLPGEGTHLLRDEQLNQWADALAFNVETSLHERCTRLAKRLSIVLGGVRGRGPRKLFDALAGLALKEVNCDTVLVFLEERFQNELRLESSVGKTIPSGRDAIGLPATVNQVYKNNREVLTDYADSTTSGVSPALVVPLRDLSGRARGAICCVNWVDASKGTPPDLFTYDEVAVVDALVEAFASQLEILLAEQHRHDAFQLLGHELRVPMVAFRAVLERLHAECNVKRYEFQYNHFDELSIYGDLMRGLLERLDIIRVGPDRVSFAPRFTNLLTSIIAPTKRFLRPLLRQRFMHPDQIVHGGFEDLPKLCIDPALMTQVVFNLLENAIKYHGGEPATFRVDIRVTRSVSGCEISFRDYGIGVPRGEEERIFLPGERGSNVRTQRLGGEGMGLWLARELVRRHGGELRLAHNSGPTEFVITLRQYLKYHHPGCVESHL